MPPKTSSSSQSHDQIDEAELKSVLDSSSSATAAETYFTEGDGEPIDINTFRFSDGETILTYACANNTAVARVLLEIIVDIDVSICNAQGQSPLWKTINNTRISGILCEMLLEKMPTTLVSIMEMERATERSTRAQGGKSSEGCKALILLQEHDKKVRARLKTESPAAAKASADGASATAASTAVASVAVAEQTEPTIDLTLAPDDPDICAIRKLQGEMAKREAAFKARVAKARQVKRGYEEFAPRYQALIEARKRVKETEAVICELVGDESLDVIVARNELLVPGLKAAVDKTRLLITATLQPVVAAAAETEAEAYAMQHKHNESDHDDDPSLDYGGILDQMQFTLPAP